MPDAVARREQADSSGATGKWLSTWPPRSLAPSGLPSLCDRPLVARPHKRYGRRPEAGAGPMPRFRSAMRTRKSSLALAPASEDERPRDPAVVALPEIDRAAVFRRVPVAGAPGGAPALPVGW